MNARNNERTNRKQQPPTYEYVWCNNCLTGDATSIDEMVESLEDAAAELRHMQSLGVRLDPDGGFEHGHERLVVDDPAVAEELDFELAEPDDEDDDEDEDEYDEPGQYEDDTIPVAYQRRPSSQNHTRNGGKDKT